MNRHVAELAKAAGVDYLDGASVEQVELGEPHRFTTRTRARRWSCAPSG